MDAMMNAIVSMVTSIATSLSTGIVPLILAIHLAMRNRTNLDQPMMRPINAFGNPIEVTYGSLTSA
jgi:hypothetical protein